MNTCKVKSSEKIIMATKKWKFLRTRPDRGNGCCHGNRVFEIKLKSKSLNRFSFTDNSRRHQQDPCAFLMNIVYRSKNVLLLAGQMTLHREKTRHFCALNLDMAEKFNFCDYVVKN